MNSEVWVLVYTKNKKSRRGVNTEIETSVLQIFENKPSPREINDVVFDEGFYGGFDIVDLYQVSNTGKLEIEGAVISIHKSTITPNNQN